MRRRDGQPFGRCARARRVPARGFQAPRSAREAAGARSFFSHPARRRSDGGRPDVSRSLPSDLARPRKRRSCPHIAYPVTTWLASGGNSTEPGNLLPRGGPAQIPGPLSRYPGASSQSLSGYGSRSAGSRCIGGASVAGTPGPDRTPPRANSILDLCSTVLLGTHRHPKRAGRARAAPLPRVSGARCDGAGHMGVCQGRPTTPSAPPAEWRLR